MIAGLQKMTLLDYPGRVACTVFLQGCNFRCPFCHNTDLLPPHGEELMTEDALIAFLEKRTGLLDGVCITGGEPTLYHGLPELLRRIKALGYAVKLDTNGFQPQILKDLVGEKRIDYVAVDVKNSPLRYAQTAGVPGLKLEKFEETIRFLLEEPIPYELRTTVVEPLHDEASIRDMGIWLSSLTPGKKPAKLFLQGFVDRDTVAFDGLRAAGKDTMEKYVSLLRPYIGEVALRGE